MHLDIPTAIPVRIQSHKQATEQNNMTITDSQGYSLMFIHGIFL